PFEVGEQLTYNVRVSKIGITWGSGQGVMSVLGIDTIRGRPAYHTTFSVKGGIPFVFKVNDLQQSWIDIYTLSSLRFIQDLDEGPKERQRHFEMFPEKSVFRELSNPAMANVD